MVLCVFGASQAQATWQRLDTLIYEGKEYPIFNTMMSDYFVKYPDRNPNDESEGRCSGSWRGYEAEFEVSDNLIYLKDIFSKPCSLRTSALMKVNPDGKKLLVDWYSGFLISVGGENTSDLYSNEFLDSFERYAFFEVKAGKIGQVRQFDNKGYLKFKKLQFEGFKKTERYEELVKRFGNKPRESADSGIYWSFLFDMDRFYF